METSSTKSERQLVRGLTLTHAVSLVVGTVIGTGVFLKAAVMAQTVGSPYLVLGAWIFAGLLSLAGALTYGELGALFPRAGGEYVYLREAYGDALAFLYGWMRMVVGSTGSIAGLAVGFATFVSVLLPLNGIWLQHSFTFVGQNLTWHFGTRQVVAVGVILLISAINCAGVSAGGRIQSVLTALKVMGIAVIIVGVFVFSKGTSWANLATPSGVGSFTGLAPFGAAMLAALWAYDGWNQMPMVAAEVQHPERNLPRALIVGMVVVMFLYCLANLAYFYAVPFNEILISNSTKYREALPVATKAAQTFLGSMGIRLVSVLFLVSTLGALNGTILMCARVPYAMARDGLFFHRISSLTESTRVPVRSIILQAAWASILAISGTYDQLTDCVIFASWIFYGLVTSSIFVLRKKAPASAGGYRTPGYPVVPVVFLVLAGWLVLNTLQTRPVESTVGLALIASGLPFYVYFRRTRKTASVKASAGV